MVIHVFRTGAHGSAVWVFVCGLHVIRGLRHRLRTIRGVPYLSPVDAQSGYDR